MISLKKYDDILRDMYIGMFLYARLDGTLYKFKVDYVVYNGTDLKIGIHRFLYDNIKYEVPISDINRVYHININNVKINYDLFNLTLFEKENQ